MANAIYWIAFFGGWILALVIIILEGNFMRDFPLCLMTLFIIIIPLVCYFAYLDFKKQKSMGWR